MTPGGDLSLHGNLEYRITIAGPVAIAPFVDLGVDPILRDLSIADQPSAVRDLLNTLFGCPVAEGL